MTSNEQILERMRRTLLRNLRPEKPKSKRAEAIARHIRETTQPVRTGK